MNVYPLRSNKPDYNQLFLCFFPFAVGIIWTQHGTTLITGKYSVRVYSHSVDLISEKSKKYIRVEIDRWRLCRKCLISHSAWAWSSFYFECEIIVQPGRRFYAYNLNPSMCNLCARNLVSCSSPFLLLARLISYSNDIGIRTFNLFVFNTLTDSPNCSLLFYRLL